MTNRSDHLDRRAFFKRASALAMMGAGAPLALNLASVGEAAAFTSTDYKALVCVFLYGGNDHANTLIPYDLPNYDLYSAIRGGGGGRTAGGTALGHAQLANTALTPAGGQTLHNGLRYALSPRMTEMKALFDAGQMAVQLNVGPLVVPLTIDQYRSTNRTSYPLPPKLFSHNDQQSVWQSLASEGSTVGWGGRMGDLALSSNGLSTLTCISASGNAVYMSGNNAVQYQISPTGAVGIAGLKNPYFGTTATRDALRTLITRTSSQVLENEYATVTRRSIDMEATVTAALSGVNVTTSFDTNGSPNPLARQLNVIAKLIAARNTLGARRQVFFVSLGGFDNHDNLNVAHPDLLGRVDEAIGCFYRSTVELGVADKVTTFTASDFGRTLAYNGDGSDHGWGSHHFIVGGAVQGRRFYGRAPTISITDDEQVGQGRLLPTTSVDQMAATLAQWFGVSGSELPTVLPNIGRFSTSNLGFMG